MLSDSKNDETLLDDATVYDPSCNDTEKTVLQDNGLQGDTTLLQSQSEVLTSPANHIRKGTTLLNLYRVESDALEGGMGRVFKVHHTNWNTDLALKQPHAHLFQDDSHKELFVNECEVWINLGLHPHIVSCYYVRQIDGTPSIFSEWMEGGSLGDQIKSGNLYEGSQTEQLRRIFDIAIQYARGLHYAHESEIIHQDVKPDNLLLDVNSTAKVADFGIARAREILQETESAHTDEGTTILVKSGGYTPAYCSPEQMRGEQLTRRTDIWSWAVTLLEMLLGERLWQNGVVAGLGFEEYLEQSDFTIPSSLSSLLRECFAEEESSRIQDFSCVDQKMKEIYSELFGQTYPRVQPKAAADTADSLNNRALSFYDIENFEQANAYWKEALSKDPKHYISKYNWILSRWRQGLIDDLSAVSEFEAFMQSNDDWRCEYFYGLIHLERSDSRSAATAFELALAKGGDVNIIKPHLEQAESICGVDERIRKIDDTDDSIVA